MNRSSKRWISQTHWWFFDTPGSGEDRESLYASWKQTSMTFSITHTHTHTHTSISSVSYRLSAGLNPCCVRAAQTSSSLSVFWLPVCLLGGYEEAEEATFSSFSRDLLALCNRSELLLLLLLLPLPGCRASMLPTTCGSPTRSPTRCCCCGSPTPSPTRCCCSPTPSPTRCCGSPTDQKFRSYQKTTAGRKISVSAASTTFGS